MNALTAVLTTPFGLFFLIGLLGLLVVALMYAVAGWWLRRLQAPLPWRRRYVRVERPQVRARPVVTVVRIRPAAAERQSAGEIRWALPRTPASASRQPGYSHKAPPRSSSTRSAAMH